MNQQDSTESEGLFTTVIFAVIVLGGAFAGRQVCAAVLPDTQSALIVATAMVPLGVIIGISFGLGSMPPNSIMDLFSIFGERHTVEEIIARTGGSGGAASLALATIIGTAATCAGLAVAISVFLKPEVTMGELTLTFGGFGFVYGSIVAAVAWFGLSAE